MTNSILTFILIIPIIFFSSCGDSLDYDVRGKQYLVTSTKADLRDRPRENSRNIGRLKKGDVVVASYAVREWIVIEYKDGFASVDTGSVKSFEQIKTEKAFNPELNPVAAETKEILGEYGDWASWKFWAVLIGLSFLSIIFLTMGTTLPPIERIMQEGVIREWGHYFPYFTAVIGFLFAIVFLFWRDSVLHSIFVEPFWWYPEGKGGVAWYLWFISLMSIIGAFVWLIINLVLHRLKGLFLMIFFMFSGTVTFLNVVYISTAGIVIALGLSIVALIIGFFFVQGDAPSQSSDNSEGIEAQRKKNKKDEEAWALAKKRDDEKRHQDYLAQKHEKDWWDDYNRNK